MSDWFSYLSDKAAPRPAHLRAAPAADKVKQMSQTERVTDVEKPSQIDVEETDASDSMILRVFKKFR